MTLPPAIVFDWTGEGDPAFLRDREWLVTNGLGGYASGTLLGIGTRRYHGLFVPNLVEPKGRHIMISRFDEEIDVDGRCVRLGGAEFLDGRLETTVFYRRGGESVAYTIVSGQSLPSSAGTRTLVRAGPGFGLS